MSEPFITLDEFQELVPSLCTEETAAGNGKGWTPDNPTWGHCTIVAALAQNHFGGELMRASLEGTPFAEYRSHYWNRLSDGTPVDFTEQQFGDRLDPMTELEPVVRTRQYALGPASDAGERYAKLAFRFIEETYDDPMLGDEIYRECIKEALQSPCQKMGKGAVIVTDEGDILFSDHNRTVKGLEHLCAERCIRFDIPSRTDSLIGSCGHAEEVLLTQAATAGYELPFLHVYVATVGANGIPHNERPRPEFTCLRCSIPMVQAELGSVNVVFNGEWHRQTPQEAVKSASAYAMGEKKI